MSYIDEIPEKIALNSTVFEAISQSGKIEGSTERYRVSYEFDVSNPESYAQAWVDYPNAWNVYLGTSGVTYAAKPFAEKTAVEGISLDNPIVLQAAIAFYIYTVGEDTLFAEAQREVLLPRVLNASDGTPLTDDGRIRSLENYINERGSGTGTYENPNAFYDPGVYDNVVSSDGFLPRVVLDGSQTLANKYSGMPILDLLPSDEQVRTEYESVLMQSESAYGWGSPYATGGKKARE